MKPIIMDMKEMSDSTEVYESRPNPFIIYFIYFLVAMFGIAIMWMAFSKIDIVVKSSGMIKSDNEIYDVSSSITGKIIEVNVKDGQFVNEGDVLYTLEVISLGETIKYYQSEYNNVNARLKILHAYVNYLDGDSKALDAFSDNVYYKEISNRKELFDINKNVSTENKPEIASCEENIVILEESILQYEGKIEKLNQVNNCIASRNNTFSNDDSYYKSLVDSYISNYNLTESQYDKSILEFEKLLEEYNKQINKEDFTTEISETTTKIESLKLEKEQALINLELQQVANVEQQIDGLKDTIFSLKSNLSTTKSQLKALIGGDSENSTQAYVLNEKNAVLSEILTYQSKKDEYENYLNKYDIQDNSCSIKAIESGYFYFQQDVKDGAYVQEGTNLGAIYPEAQETFSAQVYVANSDIAKLKEGQTVKFEIAAYPSSEYGYFMGKIINIPKDITVDNTTGAAYYVVEVSCDNKTLKNKDGESATLLNGMACQAKIVIDEENVLKHFLRKIDLLD